MVGCGALSLLGYVQAFYLTGQLSAAWLPQNYRQVADTFGWSVGSVRWVVGARADTGTRAARCTALLAWAALEGRRSGRKARAPGLPSLVSLACRSQPSLVAHAAPAASHAHSPPRPALWPRPPLLQRALGGEPA